MTPPPSLSHIDIKKKKRIKKRTVTQFFLKWLPRTQNTSFYVTVIICDLGVACFSIHGS